MATITDYLTQLQTDKQTLINNLVSKGVDATSEDTFTTLAPKVLDLSSGAEKIIDGQYLFYMGHRVDQFNYLMSLLDTTDWSYLFSNIVIPTENTEIDLEKLNTSNVERFYCTFQYGALKNKTELNLNDWDVSKATTFESMFSNVTYVTKIDISDWIMKCPCRGMFRSMSSLKEVVFARVENRDDGSSNSFERVFAGCTNLEKVDLSRINTTNVSIMTYMFQNCSSLKEIDLSSLHTTNLYYLDGTFDGCTSLEKLDIRGLDFEIIRYTSNAFRNVPANCEIIVGTDQDKEKVLLLRSDFTNVKTVAEL